MYLLDTNIVSDLVREPHGIVAGRIATVGENNVVTSIIVAGELRYGAERRASARLTAQVEALLGVLPVLSLNEGADVHYGRVRAQLEGSGQVIGANDLLIAAHALAIGAILVTDNLREFARVEGLSVENWLRPN